MAPFAKCKGKLLSASHLLRHCEHAAPQQLVNTVAVPIQHCEVQARVATPLICNQWVCPIGGQKLNAVSVPARAQHKGVAVGTYIGLVHACMALG